jgi:hypothetical protein
MSANLEYLGCFGFASTGFGAGFCFFTSFCFFTFFLRCKAGTNGLSSSLLI